MLQVRTRERCSLMPGGRRVPLTDAQKAEVLRHHGAGLSRGAIARTTGLSEGSVTKIVHAAGKGFDREATQVAVKARQMDLKALRVELEHDLIQDAIKLRQRVWEPREYAQPVGGMEPRIMHWTMDEPTPADQAKLIQAAGAAITSSAKLAEQSKDDGLEGARSMLSGLMTQLGQAFREAQTEET